MPKKHESYRFEVTVQSINVCSTPTAIWVRERLNSAFFCLRAPRVPSAALSELSWAAAGLPTWGNSRAGRIFSALHFWKRQIRDDENSRHQGRHCRVRRRQGDPSHSHSLTCPPTPSCNQGEGRVSRTSTLYKTKSGFEKKSFRFRLWCVHETDDDS